MHHTEAIILSQKNIRENDKIISFYTKDFGKVEILARGARKIQSKLAGHLQFFALLNIGFAKGKNFNHLTSAILKNNYSGIKISAKQINPGMFCLKTVNLLIKPFRPDVKIFNLLEKLFELLNADYNSLTAQFFVIKLLAYLGYAPELYLCVNCKNKIKEEENFFNFNKGGLICPKCHKNSLEEVSISPQSIKILRLFLKENLEVIRKLIKVESSLKEVEKIVLKFLQYHFSPVESPLQK